MYDKLLAFSTNCGLFVFYQRKSQNEMRSATSNHLQGFVAFGLSPPPSPFHFILFRSFFSPSYRQLLSTQKIKLMDKTDDSRCCECLANYYYHIKFYSCNYKISISTMSSWTGVYAFFLQLLLCHMNILSSSKRESRKNIKINFNTLHFCART